MAFVDDEEEEDLVPQSASKYYFEDDDKVPLSFADLPIQWSVKDKVNESATILYLRGTSGDGLLPLHKSVKAWRFDLSNFKPEISVLTKDNIWIKLQKPRKSYEELIRTVLVTLHSLQFLRRNPNASDKSLWVQLSRAFGSHDVRPSQNDLVDHIDLIAEAVKRDVNLAKSKFLLTFLAKKPTKKRLPDEDNPRDAISKFIVGDDMSLGADENDMDDDDDDYFDSVCAICDNGGDLLCCEGSCLRSFHATKKDGEDSFCDSLGLEKQVEEIQSYFCGNCEHKIHQCFICNKLGSSDNSIGAEVFQCVSATCGYFYHPRCIARRLHLGDKAEAKAQEERIIAGESFTCPLHKCCVCTKGEVKTDTNLQFAVCRRCPKSYHRKCLPREISFGEIKNEGTFTRAWDGLLHNRVLIYCLDHEIEEELMTPIRDHLKFPFTEEKKMIMKEQSKILDSHVGKDKARPKVNDLALRDNCEKGSVKSFRRPFPSSKDGASTKKHGVDSLVPDSLRKQKEVDPSRKSILVPKKFQKNTEFEESCEADRNKVKVNEAREVAKTKVELKEACKADNNKVERVYNDLLESDLEHPGPAVSVDSKHHRTDSIALREPRCEVPTLDNDSKRRLLAVMEKATEEITMDTMLKKYKVTSTHHTNSLKNLVDKTITMGKVKGSVQAVRTALKKLEDGENIEDAKAVCEPEVLSQIFKWKEKLRVYLAPFIHGARYTSYGRHFTKADKLQQIVDRLHWYAEDGDMIVDFCCGANDFSWLMKSKLEETGKKCSYKNYDLIQAKNDFNFEMRDWLTVRKEELAPGSKLIMGLNPPFGVNASRANTFIEKALEFKPKILILIVPVETKRLDNAKSRYVLIWEDAMFLSGKSFYLPGSVDDEEKQMEDWNIVSPPLSLWSRSDFAAKHREIAEAHYHLSTKVGSSKLKENNEATNASLPPPRASADICDGNPMLIDSPLENVEHCAMESEDVPMEIDEPELAESVDRNLVSEKIKSPKPVTYEKHQSHPSPRKRPLEKMGNKKDYSEKVLGKSVGTSNETWKNKDVQEAPGELNRGPESIGTKIPERTTSDKQSPLQSDRDDIYDVCAPLSNSIVRFQESVEVSPPGTSRTRSNWEEDVREPDSTVRNRPSFVRSSSREDTYSVRPSPAHSGQKTHEALEASNAEISISHFNDDLAAKYGFGGGYRMPDPHCMPDQFPLAPSPRDDPNQMFSYRPYSGVDARTQFYQYGQANMGSDSREYLPRYGGHVDPMSAPPAPPPPHRMDNNPFPMQRYPPRFDELNYQRMDSFPPPPPPPPLLPNGNSFYDSPGLPPPPPPGDFRSAPLSFAPGLDYQYYRGRPTGSAGWLNE